MHLDFIGGFYSQYEHQDDPCQYCGTHDNKGKVIAAAGIEYQTAKVWANSSTDVYSYLQDTEYFSDIAKSKNSSDKHGNRSTEAGESDSIDKTVKVEHP